MSGVKRPGFGVDVEREEAERLSPDDMAGRTSEEFIGDALLAQRLRAAGGAMLRPGLCANCDSACPPLAVYCDAECRLDHEYRLAVLARQGRPG